MYISITSSRCSESPARYKKGVRSMSVPRPSVPQKVKRAFLAFLISLSALLGLTVATATPASAGSSSCSWFNWANWGGMCQEVNGSGTWVNYVAGSFVAVRRGPVCNWQVTAEFFDTSGRWYSTKATPVRSGCDTHNWDYVHINSHVRPGFVCTSIRENGSNIASRCAGIH